MFFRRKKKLDSRVRFQHEAFTRRLNQQKHYRRRARPIPETGFGRFLAAIGLESTGSKLIMLACLSALIYVVYIPNFLFIKHVQIDGVSEADAATVNQSLDQFFSSSFAPFPQKNLLFLSSDKLSSYILEHNQRIWKIDRIQKKPFNRIVIQLQLKQERYLVAAPLGQLILFNDGTAARRWEIDPSKPENPIPDGLIKIVVGPIAAPAMGEAVLSTSLAPKLQQLADYFGAEIYQPISYVGLMEPPIVVTTSPDLPAPTATAPAPTATAIANTTPPSTVSTPSTSSIPPSPPAALPLDPQEISVYTPRKPGARDFRILFNARADLSEALNQLKLLIGALGPDKLAALSYIDLRLPDRAYVCMVNAACTSR